MKESINKIWDSTLLVISTVVFCATWPIIIFITWIKALLSDKHTDLEKVSITKEVLLLLGILIIYIILNSLHKH